MNSVKIFVLMLVFLSYCNVLSQPKLVIDGGDTYDWGKINPKGAPLSAKIKIFNKGNKTLNISEVKPGCGCTTAPLDKNVIQPKEFATLSVSLNVHNDGPVTKSISIKSNDPQSPNKNLFIKADIMNSISVSQKFISFSNMTIGKESAATVTIKNNTNKPIKITDVIAEPSKLKLNIKKKSILPVNKEFILEAKYIPDNSKNLTGKISIKTDNKEMGNIDISVWGNTAPTKK
jgi:hypothetical protein